MKNNKINIHVLRVAGMVTGSQYMAEVKNSMQHI